MQLCSPDWPSRGANESPASAALTTLKTFRRRLHITFGQRENARSFFEIRREEGENYFYDPTVVCNLGTVKGSAAAVEHFELSAAAVLSAEAS